MSREKNEVTTYLQLLQREHVLEALSRLQAGNQTNFGESRKYDLLFRGERHPPKEVAGLALQVMKRRVFDPDDFKGGRGSACFRALERCGFTVVPKDEGVEPLPLRDTLREILRLQRSYSSTNTEDMKRRGLLIRDVLPARLRERLAELEPMFSEYGYVCEVQGSDGKGRKNESPWVRIHDPSMSPSATRGWYLVLHFARNGQVLYATVGCGATVFKDGSLHDVPDGELAARIAWARQTVDAAGIDARRFADPIRLEGNALSLQFEKATAFAKAYDADRLNERQFWTDLGQLCRLLVVLYEKERTGRSPWSEASDAAAAAEAVEAVSNPSRKGRGQGRGLSAAERLAVERRAMTVAERGLAKAGFTRIVDTSATESYDFEALMREVPWKIEVKGTTNPCADTFLLTAAELTLHRGHKGTTALALVCDIELERRPDGDVRATGGKLELISPWDPDDWEFTPTAYKASRGAGANVDAVVREGNGRARRRVA